jgi:hypothetical protein
MSGGIAKDVPPRIRSIRKAIQIQSPIPIPGPIQSPSPIPIQSLIASE